MAKKINYASMFTLRKDGRYQGSYTDETGRHYVYDRDPERLWHKLNAPKEEKPLLFREIAEAWQKDAWQKIREGTVACYEAPFNRAVDRLGDRVASEIEPHDIWMPQRQILPYTTVPCHRRHCIFPHAPHPYPESVQKACECAHSYP